MTQPVDTFAGVYKALTDAETALARERQAAAEREAGLRAEIERLKNPPKPPSPSARFPGDPGRGKLLLGATSTDGAEAQIVAHEKAAGVPLAVRRRYWQPGSGGVKGMGALDLALPASLPRQARVEADKGRVLMGSWKPGPFGTISSGRFDGVIREAVAYLEGLGRKTFLLANHEPENDGQDPALFRRDQEHLRALITQACGGQPGNVSFGGSLMTYSWTPEGRGKHGDPKAWLLGPDVWDWCALDHYVPDPRFPVLSERWTDAADDVLAAGTMLAIGELGFRATDTKAAAKLDEILADLVGRGGSLAVYYDSSTNSTGTGWVMTGALRDRWRALMKQWDPSAPNH